MLSWLLPSSASSARSRSVSRSRSSRSNTPSRTSSPALPAALSATPHHVADDDDDLAAAAATATPAAAPLRTSISSSSSSGSRNGSFSVFAHNNTPTPTPPPPAPPAPPAAATLRTRVTVGATVDRCDQAVRVNDDGQPAFVETDRIACRVAVRIKNFDGVGGPPDGAPPVRSCPYFGDNGDGFGSDGRDTVAGGGGNKKKAAGAATSRRRLFSIQLQCVFKQEHTADDILFGNFFARPLRSPNLLWLPLQVAPLFEPTFTSDVHAATPWLCTVALCTVNTVCVVPAPPLPQKSHGGDGDDDDAKHEKKDTQASSSRADALLGPWEWGRACAEDGTELTEDHALLLAPPPPPSTSTSTTSSFSSSSPPTPPPTPLPSPSHDTTSVTDRRRHLSSASVRSATRVGGPGLVYNLELFSPFVDFNTFQVTVGGFSFGILPYLDGQPFHYVIKSKRLNESLLCIKFEAV